MSSLAAQLAHNASLNANLLVDRSRRKPTVSYLFTGRDADEHDLEAIHGLAVNCFLNLSSVEPKLAQFEDALFSEQAKETDRTLLTRDSCEELDVQIEELLWVLGPHLMEQSTGGILEWLVRRFRIHEFNVDAVLSLFLPYHESPHFTKMVTLLQIKTNSTWSFLVPYKSAAQNLPRVSLVTEMLKHQDVARFATSLLPKGIKKGVAHRTLIAFNAATLHDFIKRAKALDEGTMAFLLPALLEPLQQKKKATLKDSVLGSYILLASLSQKCELSGSALKVILGYMASASHAVKEDQIINSLIAVCEPQPELDKLSDDTVKFILRIPNVTEVLTSACSWTGSEKFLSPLVKGLVSRIPKETSRILLEALITAPGFTPVVDTLTRQLLPVAVDSEGADVENMLVSRRILSLIHQRYPNALRGAVDAVSEDDESLKDALEQLAISLSTVQVSGSANQGRSDIIVSSSNVDGKVRTSAVKELFKSIAGKDLSTIEDLETVRSVLITRVQDTDLDVLEALYEDPSLLTPVFASDSESFITSLSLATSSQKKPKRNILRLHLVYVTSHFWPATDPATRERIFHRVLFPFLLVTKPRHKTAEMIWDVIEEHLLDSSEKDTVGWLEGCAPSAKAALKAEGSDSMESMNQINFDFSAKIAENILETDDLSGSLQLVVSKFQDENSHARLLGYLIARSLVQKSSGERQVEIAETILNAVGIDELSGVDDLSQEHLALEKPDDITFGKYIVAKPNGKTAVQWMQIAVVAAIARIPAPDDVVLDWLANSSKSSPNGGQGYIQLMRSVYRLANSSTSLPILSAAILQLLFMSLKDYALAFLAGIWTIGSPETPDHSTAISLLHAAAFLEAHILEDDGMDFQTILPALLVALQNSDQLVCQGALECLSRIRILADGTLKSVYRFDTIYGQNDKTLQYLDQADLKKYLDCLVENRDHLSNDSGYLKIVHKQHFGKVKGEKKKDTDYKHRVICYLLSHANAVSSESAQTALLKSLELVSDRGKAQILLPTIQSIVEKDASVQSVDILRLAPELTTRLLASFDALASGLLNEDGAAWDVFLRVVRTYLRSGTPFLVQKVVIHSIDGGLFSALKQQRQIALCEVLLEVGTNDPSSQSLARKLLSDILNDVSLIIHLLESLSPAASTASPRAIKRVKTTESPEDNLPRLSLFVEILGTKSLPGSLDLISRLLDTLNNIVQSLPGTQADVSYIEQLLMSAIESTSSKIMEVPNITPSVIRIDVLVEVIRVSGNPQTFHQALLLIASLARLAPDSVLYNIMPVFTFMGSNVFHRDDSYSFKVVQQTIDGIVPVMVSSLRQAHSQPLDLYTASKEFLRVFTDAATHIPRHRRNRFFAHLVDVLGSRDFLAPVCMLLLERSANRIVRQTSEEILASLSLPLSVFQQNGYDLQIHTATEILKESQRLVSHVIDPASVQPIFLEGIVDGDHSLSSSTISKRRAQALIIFVGFALRPTKTGADALDDSTISLVIAQLLALSSSSEANTPDIKLDDISDAARSSLNRLLGCMSVTTFAVSVQSILVSGDINVQSAALEILGKRLPDVSTKMRSNLMEHINKILSSIKALLNIQKTGSAAIHAFQALRSIALTLCPGEESAMTELIPYVLSATKENDLAFSSLAALSVMSTKLGPRIIPFFRSIISQCIGTLRGPNSVLFDSASETLQGMLKTIPSFWGSSEVSQIVLLYMDQSSSTTTSPLILTSLTKSLAKRIPPKVVLPALLEIWGSLQGSKIVAKISAFFDVLARVLQQADRPTALDHLRNLFKVFLDALDIVKGDNQAAEHVIYAFRELVVKLNESAFKPLFRRLHDWAFTGETDDARKIIFNHLYIDLLDFFKALMVPYMAFVLQPFCDILKAYKASLSEDDALWSSVIKALTRALKHDDNGFWRDDKLRQILDGLTSQIEVCVRLNFAEGKPQLQDCLDAFLERITDDTLAKTTNLNILMHTRSEDPRIRIFSLSCSEALWRSHGGQLLGFVAETATFIAECGEDENDMVVKESFKLKDAVESVAGKIDGL